MTIAAKRNMLFFNDLIFYLQQRPSLARLLLYTKYPSFFC